MEFYSVIDTGAFIWDKSEEKESQYYALTALFVDFLKIMAVEKPKILMRKNLRDQIFQEFPWESQGIPNFWELTRYVSAFLTNADIVHFEALADDNTVSTPNIIYGYYGENVKTEVGYLVREMHSNTTNIKYFTFCPIWNKEHNLATKKETVDKQYDTIVHCGNELQSFIENLKPKFDHSGKHDKLISRVDIARGYRLKDNKRIYPFSANYSTIPNHAQNLLDLAISHDLEPGKLYYYDDDSDTFVCFMQTGGRIFHGFDVPEEDLHEPIRRAVMKKYEEQRNR